MSNHNQEQEAVLKLAETMMNYLNCECRYFESTPDDADIVNAFYNAQKEGLEKGYTPMLIAVDDTLWECLQMNSDNEAAEEFDFDPLAVEEYRREMLSSPVMDGKEILTKRLNEYKEDLETDGFAWEDDILGEMEKGEEYDRFGSYWDFDTKMTCPLILAKIPVKNPWEIFAYLPFGGWNECPDTPELMAITKYWFEQYGAAPAVMSHDELEFILPKPIPKERAMELVQEQYGFCIDILQNFETLGLLADTLWQSNVWYFWWD